ncbi:MAG: hydroxymethylglutaryl-CoA reductase, degradative, partial [candidate division Zixibacteria bacterium]|nr:hydroxymethylglutaryl-CoA reductase, degradative [candidate division Zixibacteria bacterium]
MKKTNKVTFRKTDSRPETRTSRIPGFYRLPVEQRLAYLARGFNLTEEQITELRNGNALRVDHAVNMVENAVGVLGIPLGLGLNFLVDGNEYLVPMAIEEASIIAAASKSALTIRKGGGFHTEVSEPVMIGQVQVLCIKDIEAAIANLNEHKKEIIEQANLVNPRMVKRGGGVFDIETRVLDTNDQERKMLIVHLLFDVREAMGANAVNYACEAVGPIIELVTGGKVNLRILSNLADHRVCTAEFSLPFEYLTTKEYSGEEVAKRLIEANEMATIDPYRAATHNKGIFNGICAAALALGQDWRAIEAGGHAYAARDGQYRALTNYNIDSGSLKAKIELPLQVGWIGGAVNTHPGIKVLRMISGVRNSRDLSSLLAAVGLGQNFAAILALATVGIQKGHMALHARSV